MTTEEAIEDLQYLITEYEAYPPETGVCTTIGTLQYAISALKEIQQYREIGTVEECREAVEKQKPVKSEDYDEDLGYFVCPSCGCTIMADELVDHKFSLCCGQALLLEKRKEEREGKSWKQ